MNRTFKQSLKPPQGKYSKQCANRWEYRKPGGLVWCTKGPITKTFGLTSLKRWANTKVNVFANSHNAFRSSRFYLHFLSIMHEPPPKTGEFGSSRLNFETFKIFMQPFSIGLDFFCGWAFFCNCHGFFLRQKYALLLWIFRHF